MTGSTLSWCWPAAVSADWQSGFMGPGGGFELVEDDVLGQRLAVFAQRPAHLRATLEQAAERYGDLPYLVFADRLEDLLTFGHLHHRVARLVPRLVEQYGVGAGDRVAIASANCVEYALLAYATASIGAIIVGLNGWWTGDELAYGLELTQPTLVAADERRLERLQQSSSPRAGAAVSFADLFAGLDDAPADPLPAA